MPPDGPEFGIEIAPQIEEFNNNWSKAFLGLAVVGLARAAELVNPNLTLRDYLPEPFDVPDHAGNIAGMGFIVFPFMRGWLKASHEHATTREWFDRDIKKLALIMGGLTVTANALGELVGYGSISTPDPIDFAYGLAGGFIYYKAVKPTFLPESIINDALEFNENATEPSEQDQAIANTCSRFKQKIDELKDKIQPRSKQKPHPKPPQPRARTRKPGTKQSNQQHNGRYTPPKKKRQ